MHYITCSSIFSLKSSCRTIGNIKWRNSRSFSDKTNENFKEQLRERLKERDILYQSFTKNLRFVVIYNTKTTQTASQRHSLSPLSSSLLGQTMASVSMLSSFLNGEERVKARISMNRGAFSLIEAESIHVGEVKGSIQKRSEFDLKEELRNGSLSVSKVLYNINNPLTSTVELTDESLSKGFENYLELSDQVPSALRLETAFDDQGKVSFSGGILVQTMPFAPSNLMDYVREKIKQDKIVPLLHSKSTIEVLRNILPQSELDTIPSLDQMTKIRVDFHCRCSKEGFLKAISTLTPSQIEEMFSKEEILHANCHHCNQNYNIQLKDLSS